ncbi:MAG: CARDB domain-containing protein [Chloroflexota bacterium]
MNSRTTTPKTAADASPPRHRWSGRWRWQAIVAVLLAFLAMDGQPVALTYAESGFIARATHAAQRDAAPAAPSAKMLPAATSVPVDTMLKGDTRPDFRVSFAHLDDAQTGLPLSYNLTVKNDGAGGGPVTVSTILPPELANVRVNAPGFACTRRFAASGAQAGTLVTCTRNELNGGEVADLTIEANAPDQAGTYDLTATADPRDEVAEADESNNHASASLQVRS